MHNPKLRVTMGRKGTCVSLFVLTAMTIVGIANGSFVSSTTSTHADTDSEDAASLTPYNFLSSSLFEGDLKLTNEEVRQFYRIGQDDDVQAGSSTHVRNTRALSNLGNLWPNAVIRYNIAPNVSQELVDTIYNAMEKWEDETCLRFLPRRSSDLDYVNFTTENVCNGDIGACCSDSVGRKGGEQKVSLHGPYCNHEGTILHLIGHVIGFWHEESRPDRDSYISINYNNIQPGAHDQFQKRDDLNVDYQGVGYDYGSIMHLPRTTFASCANPLIPCYTMDVTNIAEYSHQGNPTIGQLRRVSDYDGKQASRLYNCPSSGVLGRLRVYVLYGQNFPATGEDVYVKVTAVDSSGDKTNMQTNSIVTSLASPNWTQELVFGEREWQFFRIRVYGEDPGNDDAISMSETVVVVEGNAYESRVHCLTTHCTTKVKYRFVVDRNECLSKPCQNGGTCIDELFSYTCHCSPGWVGSNCNIRLACYSMPCQNGGACADFTDYAAETSNYTCICPSGWTGINCHIVVPCHTNPCQHGGTCTDQINYNTGISSYTCSCPPDWIGRDCQSRIACSNIPCRAGGTCTNIITNYDTGTSTYSCSCPPDWIGTNCGHRCPCRRGTCVQPATPSNYQCICPSGWIGKLCNTRIPCYTNPCLNGGTCKYTTGISSQFCSCPPGWTGTICHIVVPCHTNPCQHGGTCTDHINHNAGISSYFCSCPPDWIGTNCERRCPCIRGTCVRPAPSNYQCICPSGWIGGKCNTRYGRLRFFVRYGTGLQDRDPWLNDSSDPYVKIIAFRRDGHSVTKTTRHIGGDQSPGWYEWLDFGEDTWSYFKIRVYDDDDVNSDDSLSSWQTVGLSALEETYLTHYCYSGYIKYDYHYY